MKLIPDNFQEEIKLRVFKIKQEMDKAGVDSLLVGSNANIYYTTGRFFRGYVFIPINGNPVWFVIKPQVWDEGKEVKFIRKPEQIPSLLEDEGYATPQNIGFENDDLSYSDITRLQKLFPETLSLNGSPVLKRARMVKTEWELSEMKADGRHHTHVYAQVKDCYKPGMSDLQLQIEIEKRLRLEGALGISRVSGNLMEINLGSVISGDNADNPAPYEFTMGGSGVNPAHPVGADGSPILEGQVVMIDMNGAFNGYQTDMTRVWSLGDPGSLALKAHQCSIDILRKLEKESLPGVEVSKMYEMAMEIVVNAGLESYFMGHRSQVGFIGHGVGIELNELPVVTPRSKDFLEKNMTLALEPKFVIPHVGAVGVENTYIVGEKGLENITVFPEEIQKF